MRWWGTPRRCGAGSLSEPTSRLRYTCTLSALTTSPPRASASRRASSVCGRGGAAGGGGRGGWRAWRRGPRRQAAAAHLAHRGGARHDDDLLGAAARPALPGRPRLLTSGEARGRPPLRPRPTRDSLTASRAGRFRELRSRLDVYRAAMPPKKARRGGSVARGARVAGGKARPPSPGRVPPSPAPHQRPRHLRPHLPRRRRVDVGGAGADAHTGAEAPGVSPRRGRSPPQRESREPPDGAPQSRGHRAHREDGGGAGRAGQWAAGRTPGRPRGPPAGPARGPRRSGAAGPAPAAAAGDLAARRAEGAPASPRGRPTPGPPSTPPLQRPGSAARERERRLGRALPP